MEVVETAWPLDGRVNGMEAIRRSDDDHAPALFHAVQQDQQLGEERNFVLAGCGTSRGCDGVKLVDENNTWCQGLSAVEGLA